MNRNMLVAVGVMVSLAAFGGWQTLEKSGLQSDLDTLQSSHDRWSKANQEQIDQLNKSLADLRQELKDTQSQLALAKAEKPGPAATRAPGVATTPQPAVATGKQQNNQLPAAVRDMANRLLSSPDARAALAQQMLTSQYGAFLRSLNLSPEKETALKQRLLDLMTRQMERQQKFANGEITQSELVAGNAGKQVESIMGEYLDSQQMDAYKTYQADAPVRARAQLEAINSMQLATQAPGLSDASRAKVASAIANVTLSPAGAQAGAPRNQDQIDDAIETSLQDSLSEDQMKIAREYLRQRNRLTNALRQGQ